MQLDLNGAYAVVSVGEKGKPAFCKLKVKGNQLIATLQNMNTGTVPDVENIETNQIIALINNADLVPDGTAYGVKIRPWVKSEKLKEWGIVNYWRTVSEYETSIIRQSFAKVQLRLVDKYKLKYMLQPINININIVPNRGSKVGTYAISREDGAHDVMTLMPPEFELESTTNTIAHECGHKVWVMLDDKIKRKWIDYYATGCKLSEITVDQLKQARRDWINSGEGVRSHAKTLEGENKTIFLTAVDWVVSTYNLKYEFLDILRSQGDKFNLFWPSTPNHVSDIQGLVSEYSATNPLELFCESLGLLISKQNLPEEARSLMVTSLRSFRKK